MLVAEFLGTGILTLVVLSVQRSSIGAPYFIAIAAGLAIAAASLIFGSVSGSHFNPAITLGMWSARKIRTLPAISYVAVQLLGAWSAYGVYRYFVDADVQKITSDFSARILIAEAIGAFIFAVVWAAVSVQKLSASILGVGFTISSIAASAASIALLNPAVALGTRAWLPWGTDVAGWGTYALGPIIGAVIGFNLYHLLFAGSDRATTEGETLTVAKTTITTPKAVITKKTTVTSKPAVKAKAKTTAAKKRK